MYPGVEQLQAIRPQVILNIKLRSVKKEEKERKKEKMCFLIRLDNSKKYLYTAFLNYTRIIYLFIVLFKN